MTCRFKLNEPGVGPDKGGTGKCEGLAGRSDRSEVLRPRWSQAPVFRLFGVPVRGSETTLNQASRIRVLDGLDCVTTVS